MNAGAPDPGAPGPGAAGAIALIVLAQLVLASKGIFAKVLYAEGVGVVTLIALRGAIALPLFWAFALWRLGGRALIEVSPRAVAGSAAAGFVCYYIGSYLDFTALELIDASLERVLLYSFPAIVVLIEAARRKTLPAARQWVALVLAYAGIVLVMGGFDVGLLAPNLVRAAVILICAVTFAAYFLAGQAISPRIGSIRFTVYAHTAAAAGLGAHFAVTAVPGALTLSATAWSIVRLAGIFNDGSIRPGVPYNAHPHAPRRRDTHRPARVLGGPSRCHARRASRNRYRGRRRVRGVRALPVRGRRLEQP